ncbi:hypothetical protein HPB52_022798 [Rhipicephalus sanguineus]|uniref:HTH CENPB-type domain-containing protein n=1 Tax=Rhipicephalus sanguineus TaxID=34632 RepID=A0A9D4QIG9_RHISA|nr:hypothetical protein HPB52_022798 [Rhipicephalus sanguineus]
MSSQLPKKSATVRPGDTLESPREVSADGDDKKKHFSRKSFRGPKNGAFPEIELALTEFVREQRAAHLPVSMELMQAKARELAREKGIGLEAQAPLAVTDGGTGVLEKPKPSELQQNMIMVIVNEGGSG